MRAFDHLLKLEFVHAPRADKLVIAQVAFARLSFEQIFLHLLLSHLLNGLFSLHLVELLLLLVVDGGISVNDVLHFPGDIVNFAEDVHVIAPVEIQLVRPNR